MVIFRAINKFSLILSRDQKFRIIPLVLLMVIGGVLESFSVSLIMPFMDFIMDTDSMMGKWYVSLICEMVHINSARGFLILTAAFLAVLYVLKNIYLMFEYNMHYKYVYGCMFDLQKRLLKGFIKKPYEYYLDASSGEIIRVISSDTSNAFNVLTVLLSLCSESIVSAMLVVVILIMAPIITICLTVVLLLLMSFIFLVIKPMLRQAGINNVESTAGMNKWMLQSINGIKEIKVMQREKFFQQRFSHYGVIYIDALRKVQVLGTAPRFIIEGVCLGAMFFIVSMMIYAGIELETLIPVLTVVALAAMRLLPAVNRISGSLNIISYSDAMLDKVLDNIDKMFDEEKDLDEKAYNIRRTVPKLEDSIVINSVRYHYPNAEGDVLHDASLAIHKGETVGIVGTSGAGKSTLIDIMLCLLQPQSGQVTVDGIDVREDIRSWLDQIAYIPQTIFLLDGTIKDNITFGEEASSIKDEDVWEALKGAALYEFVQQLPSGLYTDIGERGIRLSGGQRQRIGIARALYLNSEVIILDEATSSLDNATEEEVMEAISKLRGNKTLVIIAHRLTTIEGCDHIYRVDEGKITKER